MKRKNKPSTDIHYLVREDPPNPSKIRRRFHRLESALVYAKDWRRACSNCRYGRRPVLLVIRYDASTYSNYAEIVEVVQ